MAYEYLNLIDGDLLTFEHIRHLEEGITDIENSANDMKSKLIAILRDKDITVSEDESLSDILQKFTYLKNPDINSYEYSEDIIDIRETVQPEQIQMVSLDTSVVGFNIAGTKGFIVDWGDGNSDTYSSSSLTSVTHTYNKGTGQYYDGTSTQFVITIIPLNEGKITRFASYSYSSNPSGYNQNKQILAFAAKDIYFTETQSMFYGMSIIKYIDIFGGSLGSSDLNFSMNSFARECINLIRISGNVCWNSVTSMQYAFYNCKNLSELDLGNTWDTRNNSSFEYSFYTCKSLKKIPAFYTNNTTSLYQTFAYCSLLETVSGDSWDLTNCTSLNQTFLECTSLTTLPYLKNTNNVTSMYCLFYNCSSLKKLNDKQLKLECESVTSADSMFYGCSMLEESPELNLISATIIRELYYGCSNLYIIQEVFNLPQVTGNTTYNYDDRNNSGMDGMFQNCTTLTNAPQIVAPNAISIKNLFNGCSNLINVPNYFSFPECICAHNMFKNCALLQTAPSTIELPKATHIWHMFSGCSNLKVGPASSEGDSFEFPEAIYAYNLFYNCSSMQTAPVELKLPKATNISNIFNGCSSMLKAPEIIEIGSATSINGLFSNCSSMQTSPIRISAPNATSANQLFYNCSSLLVCPELDLPVCTSATECFRYCRALTATIPYHFNVINNITSFYRDCSSLNVIEEIISDATTLNITGFAAGDNQVLISVAFPKCTNGHITWTSNNDSTPVWTQTNYCNALKTYTNSIDVYSSIYNLTNYILASNYLEGTITLSGLKNAITINNKPYLTGFRLENTQTNMANLTITNCALDETAINQLFTDLPTVSTARTISVKGNPGAATCDTSIATAKNWTVVTV